MAFYSSAYDRFLLVAANLFLDNFGEILYNPNKENETIERPIQKI